MSDTTITPEERAAIRSPSERWDALWYPHDRCHKMMLRLLTALEAADGENARLREVLESITGIVNAAPELNMSNYDEDQVSALNDDMINVCRILQTEAARRAVADEEKQK